MLERLLAGEDLVGRGRQERQEVELLGRELDDLRFDLDPVGGPVDDESVVLDPCWRCAGWPRRSTARIRASSSGNEHGLTT